MFKAFGAEFLSRSDGVALGSSGKHRSSSCLQIPRLQRFIQLESTAQLDTFPIYTYRVSPVLTILFVSTGSPSDSDGIFPQWKIPGCSLDFHIRDVSFPRTKFRPPRKICQYKFKSRRHPVYTSCGKSVCEGSWKTFLQD